MSFLDDATQIAFLGPGGSYTEIAKDKFCEKYGLKQAYYNPMRTIKEVVEFVDNTPNAVGVLPIENSIEGTVRETIDYFVKTKNEKIKFLSEVIIPINHCLVSRTTELYSITGLIAHPKAVDQCQKFIKNELPIHLNIIETANTDEAARKLQEFNLTYAVIGSEKTAQDYNLNILRDNISDEEDNKTRFVLFGDFETPCTDNDYTTVAFSTQDKTGALFDILQIFKEHDMNITFIDSRPSRIEKNEYMFIVDFQGNICDEKVQNLLADIKQNVPYYRFVGSYERF